MKQNHKEKIWKVEVSGNWPGLVDPDETKIYVFKMLHTLEERTIMETVKQTDNFVSGCEKSITIQEMVQMLRWNGVDTGVIRLYQWMRDNGYVYRQPCGQNLPTEKSLELGVLEVRKRQYEYACGYKTAIGTLAVTPKGQEYFMLLLGGDETCPKRKSA